MSLVYVSYSLPSWLDPLEVVFDDLFQWVENVVDVGVNWLRAEVHDIVDHVADWIWDVGITIAEGLHEKLNAALLTITELDIPILSDITQYINNVSDWIWDAAIAIKTDIIDVLSAPLTEIPSKLIQLGDTVISSVKDLPLLIGGSIGELGDNLSDFVTGKFDILGDALGRLIDSMVTAFSEGFNAILPSLFSFGEFFIDVTLETINRIKNLITGTIEPLFLGGVQTISNFLSPDSPPSEYQELSSHIVSQVFNRTEIIASLPKSSMPTWENVRNHALLYAGTMSAGIIGTNVLGMAIDGTHPIKHWQVREGLADLFEVLLPQVTVGSVLQMPFEVGTLRFMEYHLQADHRPTIPSERDLLEFIQRGLIGDNTFYEYMAYQGFSDEWIATLREAYRQIPSPSDLVRFVVREVIRPERFYEIMQTQGYSLEYAQMYWDAHWDLPSVGQVLEAFHRQLPIPIVELDEQGRKTVRYADSPQTRLEALEQFLVLADYAPEWRTMIRDINYAIITRVDARRVWELGVIDDDQLEFIMLQNGYSPADAKLVADAQKLEVVTAERNELIDRIGDLYVKGWISRDDAGSYLLSLDLKKDVVDFQLAAWDFEQDRLIREEYLAIYLKQYADDLITDGELTSYLLSLGLQEWRVYTEITYIKAKKGEKIDFRERDIS